MSPSRPALVDTHVHLDDPALADALAARWAAARDAGVVAALAVAVEPSTWARTIAVARALPGVRAAIGIHPQVVSSLDDATLDDALGRLPDVLRDADAVAVGECGFDAAYPDRERQLRVLRAQLDVARALALPISLHVFGPGAHATTLGLLRDVGPLRAGGAVHSYSGSAELVREYVRAGLSISFAGAITRANAKRPLVAARAVPREHLLVETDAPWQPTGADARDRSRGEPRDLPEVLAALARARGEAVEEVATTTRENALRVFRGLAGGEGRSS